MTIRKIGLVSRTYRHVNRYRQTLTILFRYGFGGLIDRLKITQYLEIGLQFISRERRPQVETLSTPVRVRMMLEELGPTFVKLGQVLSTRPDALPPDFIDELSKLQQQVPPFSFELVRRTVESELGRPLDQVFAKFDEHSIAAASIGQVHRATLGNGDEVVVKVQRPNVRDTIEVDLEILLHLAMLAEKHIEDWRPYRPSRIVEEFGRVLERELDYTTEAAHLERFASQFADDETVYVPKVYREYTTPRVLTMEYVDLVPITDAATLADKGFDPKLIARRGVELTLKQLLVHGFFHADPHPGNVFVLPGNVICFLDFGMMGRLDRQGREDFVDLIYALAGRDPPQITSVLLRLTVHDDDYEPDGRRLESDVAEFVDIHITEALRDLRFGRLLHALLGLVHRHHLFIPPDLVTMLKAAATAERLVARLDPELNMVAAAEPYVRRLKLDRLRPGRVMREVFHSGSELFHLLREIPGGFRDLLRLAKRGALKINFEHRGLDKLIETHERVANRLSFAIVVAALIVGSSLVINSRLPPLIGDMPVIGLGGFLFAGAMGLVLLISILRHGRL
jgi:ubiquinone biosynthesis protein